MSDPSFSASATAFALAGIGTLVKSDTGQERVAKMGEVQGGSVSRDAAIAINDGGMATMPTIKGGAAMICSTGQPILTGVIQC